MDGIKAAYIIHSSMFIPIIFLTAHAEEQTLQRAKLVKSYGYIIKPFERDELRAAVELALAGIKDNMEVLSQFQSDEDLEEGQLEFSETDGVDSFLSTLVLFSSLNQSDLHMLSQSSSIRSIAAGEHLWIEGEKANFGFIVIRGRLSVVKSTESGKELIVELLAAGDANGIVESYCSEEAQSSIRAQIDSTILLVPRAALIVLAQQSQPFLHNLINVLAQRIRKLETLSLSLAHGRVEDRILATLCALAQRFGKSSQHEGQVRLYLTRKELADLTGTTPETAIRVTKSLERRGYLDLSRPGIIKILSVEALKFGNHRQESSGNKAYQDSIAK